MEKRKVMKLAGSVCMVVVLAAALVTACAKPAATPAPGAAPTVTVTATAPAKTTTVTVTATPAAPTAAKPIQLIVQNQYGKTSRTTYGMFDPFWDRVEKMSGGRITTKRYYTAELVSIASSLEAAAKGTIDYFQCPGTYYKDVVPLGDYDLAWFNYTSSTSAYWFWQLPEVKKISLEAYAKAGVVQIGAFPHDHQVLFTKFPVTKIEDLKGKKMRAPGGLPEEAMKALGISTVYVDSPEVYTALQRGTVDGCQQPEYFGWNMKYYEVTNYIMLPAILQSQPQRAYFNKAKWDSLGPELQKIVQDAHDYISLWSTSEGLLEDLRIRDEIKSKGMIYNELSKAEVAKMEALVAPINQKWAKTDVYTAAWYDLLQKWNTKDIAGWTFAKAY